MGVEGATHAYFLGGAVHALQPAKGYRAGTDAILLAQSLSSQRAARFLELGCGSGVVLLMAAHNMPDCSFTGLEKSADMLALSQENTKDNACIDIVQGSIRKIAHAWHLRYDQVLANPPFFDDKNAVRMSEEKAPSFVNTSLSLKDWIDAMLICLKPRGIGTIIQRADRLEHILHAVHGKAGRIKILPIHSYKEGPAKRVIVQFRKGVKSQSSLLAPLIMHEKNAAQRYAPFAQDILNGQTCLKL